MLHVALSYIQLVYLFRATSHFVQGFRCEEYGAGYRHNEPGREVLCGRYAFSCVLLSSS